jgi:hypothetical protein
MTTRWIGGFVCGPCDVAIKKRTDGVWLWGWTDACGWWTFRVFHVGPFQIHLRPRDP